VNNTGVANAVGDMELCDLNGDGLEVFDLTTQIANILGAQLPADVTLSFHLSQNDADTDFGPIITPNAYTNTGNPETIFVRVEDNVNATCFSTTTFDLILNQLPLVVVPPPLQLCDDLVADGMTEFDLTVNDNFLSSGNTGYSVTYYETLLDAQNDTSPIADPTLYVNTISNPQTIHARVTDAATGCFILTTADIEVLANPMPEPNPDDILLCDAVNDGVEVFDLSVNEVQILNGEVGNSLSYHISQNDAEQGTGAIADPMNYSNTTNPETIFVRVENADGCFAVVDFDLIVNPLPEVIAVPDLIECELSTDGLFDFDLESKTNEILNGQSPAIFSVTYHISQADADANANPIISPYTNILGNPQPIYVSITNTTTGCSISTVQFNIEVREQPTATPPANDYVICDYFGDNDGVAEFDLSTQDAEILNGQLPADFSVTYYANQMDAIDGVSALSNIYENTSNPQIIYAKVSNNLGICYEIAEVTLRVQPIPVFELDESYTVCLDSDGNVIVNGNSPPVIDTGLSDADFTFIWSYEGVVLPGETMSSLTATQAGNYSVDVTDVSGLGCVGQGSTTVIPSTTPIVAAEVTTDAFSDNHMIEVTASGNGVYEFSLDGGPYELGTDNGNGTYSYTFTNVNPPGEHTVTARDRNGCGLDSEDVFVFDYPLFFTPNGDGFNDTWNVIDFSSQPTAEIFIYDRFGKLLKQISPAGDGWNGTLNGNPLPSSDYWFTINYVEPRDGVQKQFKSHFSLKR
jgi:gliding motility-associated-like protein